MTTSKEGKQRKDRGMRFERKVRADLESKGWIVNKWTCNIDLDTGVLHPAKSFRGITRSNGFPDFIVFKVLDNYDDLDDSSIEFCEFDDLKNIDANGNSFAVIAVESKMNGVLSKVEKEKCQWYLNNNIFSKNLIASKGTISSEIVYKEFELKSTSVKTEFERGLKK